LAGTTARVGVYHLPMFPSASWGCRGGFETRLYATCRSREVVQIVWLEIFATICAQFLGPCLLHQGGFETRPYVRRDYAESSGHGRIGAVYKMSMLEQAQPRRDQTN
jgi:hypothetical protein